MGFGIRGKKETYWMGAPIELTVEDGTNGGQKSVGG
jgi:hypothetical protein